jgi:hypothetical protein
MTLRHVVMIVGLAVMVSNQASASDELGSLVMEANFRVLDDGQKGNEKTCYRGEKVSPKHEPVGVCVLDRDKISLKREKIYRAKFNFGLDQGWDVREVAYVTVASAIEAEPTPAHAQRYCFTGVDSTKREDRYCHPYDNFQLGDRVMLFLVIAPGEGLRTEGRTHRSIFDYLRLTDVNIVGPARKPRDGDGLIDGGRCFWATGVAHSSVHTNQQILMCGVVTPERAKTLRGQQLVYTIAPLERAWRVGHIWAFEEAAPDAPN